MRYTKPLLSIQQQIDILKQRGLQIDNEAEAKDALAESDTMFTKNLQSLQEELGRSEDEYILEHFRKYDEPSMPPVWKTMEVASMGTLSRLYSNMNDSAAKKAVSRSFMIPKFEYMRSWLRCITVVRNICAHHARLWNANIVVNPSIPTRMPNSWITTRQITSDKLYPHLCYIAYWLNSINPSNTFIKDIKTLLSKNPVADSAAMGFPRGWQDEPLWQ